jgi:outer membrane protein W
MKNFKKIAVLLVLGCTVLAAAGAQDFKISAGAGVFYDGVFSTIKSESDGTVIADYGYTRNGFGVQAFVDATYAEVSLDVIFGSQHQNAAETYENDPSMTHFGFSVLGKYPFKVGPVVLFPLVGIDYQVFLGGKYKYGDIDRSDLDYSDMFDAFSIVAGVGADYYLTDALYIRGSFTWNFKLDSKSEADLRKTAADGGWDEYLTIFTSGPRLRVAVGYAF